ncbi:MAG: NTP transferase domain-containing protein, partial [Anaerolineae bacterium]|nr:NTP transferase domain-containing protein [Anaerolineae bacterium]
MPNVQAIILAGGPATRLGVLSEHRTEAAVPFAGKYRLIDFTLSNCVNSGIFNVAILTQYRPHSLNEHIGIGRPWDLDRQTGGIQMLQPYLARDAQEWHRGTADAVYQNLRFFDPKADTFLILSGDHVYKMDYSQMIRAHTERRADVTLAITNVAPTETQRYGIVAVNRQNRITHFWEKPSESRGALASMGVYLFNRDVLEQVLRGKDGKRPYHFGPDIFPSLVEEMDVFAYPFLDFFIDVGTLDAYWKAQMALLDDNPPLNLYDPDWVIHT